MATLRLILGDQLNYNHSWFTQQDDAVYVMMETIPETTYVTHHLQKLLAYLKAMRNFGEYLRKKGYSVIYLSLNDSQNRQSFRDNLLKIMQQHMITRFEYLEPDEYRLDEMLKTFCKDLPVESRMVGSEHFLTTRFEIREFFKGKKQYLMESFYRYMRKKHRILMSGDQPEGGLWNFDTENRKPWDGKATLPDPLLFENDCTDIYHALLEMKIPSAGSAKPDSIGYPLNREQSLQLLQHFIHQQLEYFGTYQDAMTVKDKYLFHSRLSFSLNTKMLHPKELIDAVLDHYYAHPEKIPLSQVEGFIRQILGWREYVRGIYWDQMPGYSQMNHFNHQRPLPRYFWTGDSRMNCIRHCVSQTLETAYAHHIQRLMITGNFMLLAGVDPDEADRWYLGVYIDAIEWVEMPNTRGMSQYADGGIMASKPYVSSANYIHKMSDYCKGCHYSRDLKYGDKACPFNSLYWNFIDRNRELLKTNQRMGMILNLWSKMPAEEKAKILNQAGKYLEEIEAL